MDTSPIAQGPAVTQVLHIVGWYPNAEVPHEAPFIARHVRCLRPFASEQVWQIDVRPAERWRFLRKGPIADRTYLLRLPWHRWFLIEWLSTLLVLWAWATRDRSRPVDVVNFHIAYPNCTRIRLLRWFVRRPMVITEHFSAYRIGFNASARGAQRIKRIFHAGVPVIVVSNSLGNDIARFVGEPKPTLHVVDNAIDTGVFHPTAGVAPEEGRFFAIAGWRGLKRADLLLEALALLRAQGVQARLRMAGTGPMDAEVQARIEHLGLKEHVVFLGQLGEAAVADEMRRAHALVHASDHETYSAVCAEALCCGTPVIASQVGGIPEFVTPELGVLVEENTAVRWATVWKEQWQHMLTADRALIAARMADRAGFAAVGKRYHAVLRDAMTSHGPTP